MRKVFFLLFILGGGLVSSANAQTFVQHGTAIARIYLPISQTPQAAAGAGTAPLEKAAEELNYHFKAMSGATLEIVRTDDPASIKGPAIVLGALAEKLGDWPQKRSESREGFRLLTKGDRLLIGGESDDGVLFGAYALLEKLGCDWVMPGKIGEIIPRKASVELDRIDVSEAPDFAMRRLWYRGGKRLASPVESEAFNQWMMRQKGGHYQPAAAQTGGHYWNRFIAKHKAEFASDPSMYALRRGPDGALYRGGPQIETTNPHVIALMAQDIRDAFAKNGWPKDKAVGFPIGPSDGLNFSESPESVAAGSGRFDAASGVMDQTDQVVLLANKLFAVLGKEYPNLYLGYYSYSAYAGYPVRYIPNPRLAVTFAPISYSRYHSAIDPNSRTQPPYRTAVEKWSALSHKQGNPLIYRGYNWNLAENMLPYSKVRIWGEDLPFYKRMGVEALNVEATKAWSINGPSDWVFMKLAWNSAQDWKALLHDYCLKSFGAGAEPMERYFLRLATRQREAGQEAGSYYAIPVIFDRTFLAASEKDMAEAERSAATPEQRTRVRYFSQGLKALSLYLDYDDATRRFDFPAANRAYQAMFDQWAEAHALDSDLVATEGPEYLKRFIGPFVEQALAFSTGDYRIVQPLPDQLTTAFTPTSSDDQHLATRALDESSFAPTKTYSSTWDAQGIDNGARGSVWYRFHFKLPVSMTRQPLYLFLGSFDGDAAVWINGQKIGASGARFSTPAIFDLTKDMDVEHDNVLAIHINRTGGVNEIGVGGLFRPSFLFTGPKLVPPAAAGKPGLITGSFGQ